MKGKKSLRNPLHTKPYTAQKLRDDTFIFDRLLFYLNKSKKQLTKTITNDNILIVKLNLIFGLFYSFKRRILMTINFGCHGTTWVLDYDEKVDGLDHILDTVKKAGFKGVDVQYALLGKYNDSPEQLKEKLDSMGLKLAALTLPFSWESNVESEEEKKRADYYIDYLKHFPNALLNLPARVGPNRDNLLKRQKDIISCVNAVGKRAYENGVVASFHPHSPANSYFRIKSDYDVLFEELDTRYVGYTPDVGHIMAGGMDPLEIIKEHLSIIKHVHFKDCSSSFEWKKMGYGDIDFPAIVETLVNYGYDGWIIFEEETDEAKVAADQCVFDISKYVEKNLQPIVRGEIVR